MVLPGPEAQQLATYIGWLMHRTAGGLVAGGLFVLPSLLMLIGLSWGYLVFGKVPAVAAVLYGIKPAVTAIVLAAAWRIGRRTLHNPLLQILAVVALLAIAVMAVPFPLIIAGAALIGWLGGRYRPAWFTVRTAHGGSVAHSVPAVIDDDTPTPEHARLDWPRLARIAMAGILLWAGMLAILVAFGGWDGTLTRMAWFFSKAALLTFGGAYAVLPYVFQSAVEHYGWLSAGQMIDGLALGETTPGPLIMVVAFAGFVGGWGAEIFGPERLFLAGATAATVVTFFTFLPSFIFIFCGGPIIETTHRQPHITAPLTAITATVVGVIVNLALFFAWHVLWPTGSGGPFEWPALAIGLLAGLALFRFDLGVIPLILGCGAVGLVLHQLGLAG
jgi:chromate transporter